MICATFFIAFSMAFTCISLHRATRNRSGIARTFTASSGSTPTRETFTVNTGKDSYICGDPANEAWNMGGDVNLGIGPESDTGYKPFRAMIYFDVSAIPEDIQLVSANMKIYYEGSYDENGQQGGGVGTRLAISAHKLENSWTEGTKAWGDNEIADGVTWATRDGTNQWTTPGGDYDDSSRVDANTPGNYGWITWDIMDYVVEWSEGTVENYGLLLMVHTPPTPDTLKFLTSFQGTNNRPRLDIEYEEPNEPPTAVIDSISPNPTKEFTNITFTGHGTDLEDGTTNSGFIWKVKTEYTPTLVLGSDYTITVNNLTRGDYTVSFRVRDSKGVWSAEVVFDELLIVTPDDPPAKITDLTAEAHGGETGAINLSWRAVAEDGADEEGEARRYIIKYDDIYIDSELSFFNAMDIPNTEDIPEPRKAGGKEELAITGLESGTEYFFAIIAVDERGQKSPLSNIARAVAPDHDAPAGIYDLAVVSGEKDGEIDLTWTAPGDDDIEGRAARYIIKCSDDSIRSIWDFLLAKEIPNVEDIPFPAHPGTGEAFTVTGLEGRETYYFVIKAVDEWENEGPLSNTVDAVATDGTPPAAITGVTGTDTPDDNGKSITIAWDPSTEDDFNGYNIFVEQSMITNIRLKTPVKQINDKNADSAIITDRDIPSITDRKEYYVAVTAIDDYGNEDPEVFCYGPVISLNNLKKAQPLSDPEIGLTYSHNTLSTSYMVDVGITKMDVTIRTKEIDNDHVEITTTYDIQGTILVTGDEISHMDLYDWTLDEDDEGYWWPVTDLERAGEIDEREPDYVDKYYNTFIHPDISEDIWLFNHVESRLVEKTELEEEGEEAEDFDYKICVVAWTATAEWNYHTEEYTPKIEGEKIDSDNDGLPDTWEKDFFKVLTKYDALDDPDDDGYSNMKEYDAGTDPTVSGKHPTGPQDVVVSTDKGSGDEFPMWLIWAVLGVLVVGGILIGVLLVVKKNKTKPKPIPAQFEATPLTVPTTLPEQACPKCQKRARYVSEYQRWYCDACSEYIQPASDPSAARSQSENEAVEADLAYYCETCSEVLFYDPVTEIWSCPLCDAPFMDAAEHSGTTEDEALPPVVERLALPPHLSGPSGETVSEAAAVQDADVAVDDASADDLDIIPTDDMSDEKKAVIEEFNQTRAILERAPAYIDVTGSREILGRAKRELDEDELAKATASIRESKGSVMAIRESYLKLVEISEIILKSYQELQESNMDTSQIEALFTTGKESLEKGDFAICEQNFNNALQEIENVKVGGSAPTGPEETTEVTAEAVAEPEPSVAVEAPVAAVEPEQEVPTETQNLPEQDEPLPALGPEPAPDEVKEEQQAAAEPEAQEEEVPEEPEADEAGAEEPAKPTPDDLDDMLDDLLGDL